MTNSGLHGPYGLDAATIDRIVTITSPGAYALGRAGNDGVFYIDYVGRADSDLNGRLRDHVGTASQFKCEYRSSPKSAFEKECNLYHDFSPPRNKVHPARPAGARFCTQSS